MLGLAQLGDRLGIQLKAQLGIGWGIGIRSGLAQGSVRITCLDLVLGIGSGLGLEVRSVSMLDQRSFASPMPFSNFHPCGELIYMSVCDYFLI